MKIRITETVYVDEKAWSTEYHCPIEEVRNDVREHFAYYLQAKIDYLGLQPKEKGEE